MVDPDTMSSVADMLQIAIACCNQPPKAVAAEIECSVSAIYEAVKGTREIPAKAMRKFSKTNLIAAASMAMQATGLRCIFGYRKGDRHIQSRIVELKLYDKAADEAMHRLPELLFNKQSRTDLEPEEIMALQEAVTKLVERDNVSFNLLMELDVKYDLHLTDAMQGKKETALAATSTVSRTKGKLTYI